MGPKERFTFVEILDKVDYRIGAKTIKAYEYHTSGANPVTTKFYIHPANFSIKQVLGTPFEDELGGEAVPVATSVSVDPTKGNAKEDKLCKSRENPDDPLMCRGAPPDDIAELRA